MAPNNHLGHVSGKGKGKFVSVQTMYGESIIVAQPRHEMEASGQITPLPPYVKVKNPWNPLNENAG
jgi:hypothetical protein